MRNQGLHIFLALVGLIGYTKSQSQVLINEVSFNAVEDYTWPGLQFDWIELYNPNDHSVSLTNWHVSDDSSDLDKFEFPDTVLAAYSFILVKASNEVIPNTPFLQAMFQIGNGEEAIFLTRADGSLADALSAVATGERSSFGRCPNGANLWHHFELPSPQSSNLIEESFFPFDTSPIELNYVSGLYTTPILLEATTDSSHWDIHFTTNGKRPSASDPIWLGPIYLDNESPVFSGIDYTPTSDSWQEPINGVAKHHALRLRPFRNGIPIGAEKFATFVIHPEVHSKYPTHIASLILPEESLFSIEQGLFVSGNQEYANYEYKGNEWERSAHFMVLSNRPEMRVESDVNIRIHGRSSRHAPQKNLRLYAPDQFDQNTLDFPLLRPSTENNAYEQILLRAPEPLFSTSLFTSQLAQYLIRELNIDSPHNLPCVLLVNGHYWGLYHFEERINKQFLAQHFGANPDQVDLIDWDRQAEVIEGDIDAFNLLMGMAASGDLSEKANYDELASLLDVDSFIDYMCAQVFFANEDFAVNNVRLWRPRAQSAKWRFIFFDGDATMRQHWKNPLDDLVSNNDRNDPIHVLFAALAQNEKFLNQFNSRFIYLLNTVFTPDHLLGHLQQYTATYRPLVSEHVRRWNRPQSNAEWENALDQIQQFMLLRPALMTDHLNQLFELPFTLFPNPVDDAATLLFHSSIEHSTIQPSTFFEIILRNSHGQPVAFEPVFADDSVHFSTAHLASGMYLIEIRMPMMTYTHRMIVQH